MPRRVVTTLLLACNLCGSYVRSQCRTRCASSRPSCSQQSTSITETCSHDTQCAVLLMSHRQQLTHQQCSKLSSTSWPSSDSAGIVVTRWRSWRTLSVCHIRHRSTALLYRPIWSLLFVLLLSKATALWIGVRNEWSCWRKLQRRCAFPAVSTTVLLRSCHRTCIRGGWRLQCRFYCVVVRRVSIP